MSAPASIPQAPSAGLRDGNVPATAGQSTSSTKAKASSKQDYKGFVAGVFSGIAKLTGELTGGSRRPRRETEVVPAAK